MIRRSTERRGSVSPPLPADHVLNSGSVLFPGAFDQHGCPLVVFPVDGHDKLAPELSKAEVVDFIHYFLSLQNKKQERDGLVSVVADLRQAPRSAARFIAETLVLLQTPGTLHTAYLVQPIKKDVLKMLQKIISPSKPHGTTFKKVLLKDVAELSNCIDRSQLPPCLGGYFTYHHPSWVAFIKEIDLFQQDFLSVVQRLPACISTLRSMSRLPIPEDLHLLADFCSTNQTHFLLLRRELGLDELQNHCQRVVSKLRFPEQDPCYLAMAGTPLFTDTARDMVHHYRRITAAVAKIELLWQRAFSKAQVKLRLLQLQRDALRTTDQMDVLLTERVQTYRAEVAEDEERARTMAAEFEATVYTPAMALVQRSEDMLHTLEETAPAGGAPPREPWVGELEGLKERLLSKVDHLHQTLRAQCDFHRCYREVNMWYSLVLSENFLQGLLSGLKEEDSRTPGQRRAWPAGTPAPPWRKALAAFLRRNPPPALQELAQLAQQAGALPQPGLQRAGRQVAQRCMTLRKLLISRDPVSFGDLQMALQWQYDLLRSSRPAPPQDQPFDASQHDQSPDQTQRNPSPSSRSDPGTRRSLCRCSDTDGAPWRSGKEAGQQQQQLLLAMPPPAEGKPSSLSSFDSGFDGAGCSPLGAGSGGGRELWHGPSGSNGLREPFRPPAEPAQPHMENFAGASDTEDLREVFDLGSVGSSSRASIQIIPQVKLDSVNFEIKVQRSATPPQNPWLSLPVDDLENSYTVTITQNTPGQQRVPAPSLGRSQSGGSRDQPTQTEVPASLLSQSPGGIGDPGLSPIRRLLSSTITEGGDKSDCTSDGKPTLIWDSYDLHDQNQHSVPERSSSSVQDLSMMDWVVKVEEDLRNVEEILQRADGILAEEEEALTQEAMFDVLVRSETQHNPWELWGNEEQLGPMSASELAEAGVLGLDEDLGHLDGESTDGRQTPIPSAGSVESPSENDDRAEDGSRSAADLPADRVRLLPELRKIHVLDELILEEHLEIHKLRHQEETLEEEEVEVVVVGAHRGKKQPSATSRSSSDTSEKRRVFRHQLREETLEVERMEKSLDQELAQGRRLSRRSSRIRKVVKCSALVKFGTLDADDQELCDELLSGSRLRSQNAPGQTREETLYDALGLDSDEQRRPPQDPLTGGLYPLTDDVDGTSEPPTTLITAALRDDESDRDELVEELRSEPQRATDTQPTGSDVTCKPDASLTPEKRPDDGAFDPGGEAAPPPPVPKPRTISLETAAVSTETQHRPSVESMSESSLTSPSPPIPPIPPPPPPPTFDTPPEAPPKEPEQEPSSDDDNLICLSSSSNNNNNNNSNHNHNPFTEDPPGSGDPKLPECLMEGMTDIENTAVAAACDRPAQNPSVSPPETQTLVDIRSSDPESPTVDTLAPPTSEGLTAGDPCRWWAGPCEDVADGFQRSASIRSSRTSLPAHQATTRLDDFSEISNYKTPIVLDTGSGVMKAGFCDEELPRIIFPTIVGQPKYEEMMNGSYERESFIGHEAQHMRGVLALRHPMKNGVIHNWDDMEKIWDHAFKLLGAEPEDHPVMLTEAPMNPVQNRQRTVEVMFDRFYVPCVYVAMQAVLALYAAGRCTGVVFDSGDGASHSVPVFQGYSLQHAIQRFPLSGQDVTLHLTKLLQEQGVCMRTSAELEIAREMKERCCYVALDYEEELRRGAPSVGQESSFTMPDGQVVCLGTERFRSPEILFRPELIGRDHYGMHESLYKSVLSTDIDLRSELLGNIVLSGGNTLLAGLPERLQREVGGMGPGGGQRVRVSSPAGRESSVWRGGAALAGLPAAGGCAWISREEYDEYGPQIVFRKCF